MIILYFTTPPPHMVDLLSTDRSLIFFFILVITHNLQHCILYLMITRGNRLQPVYHSEIIDKQTDFASIFADFSEPSTKYYPDNFYSLTKSGMADPNFLSASNIISQNLNRVTGVLQDMKECDIAALAVPRSPGIPPAAFGAGGRM
jgi:hypothetical protein